MSWLDILLPKHFASPSPLMVLASHSWTAITDCMNVPSPSEHKICQLILNHSGLFPSRNTSADNTCLAGPERHLGQHASFHLYLFISEHPFNMWAGAEQGTCLGNVTLMGHSLRLDLLTTRAVPIHCLHLLPALSVKPRQNECQQSIQHARNAGNTVYSVLSSHLYFW